MRLLFPRASLNLSFWEPCVRYKGRKFERGIEEEVVSLGKIRRKLEGGMVWKLQRRKEKKVRQDREEE